MSTQFKTFLKFLLSKIIIITFIILKIEVLYILVTQCCWESQKYYGCYVSGGTYKRSGKRLMCKNF